MIGRPLLECDEASDWLKLEVPLGLVVGFSSYLTGNGNFYVQQPDM